MLGGIDGSLAGKLPKILIFSLARFSHIEFNPCRCFEVFSLKVYNYKNCSLFYNIEAFPIFEHFNFKNTFPFVRFLTGTFFKVSKTNVFMVFPAKRSKFQHDVSNNLAQRYDGYCKKPFSKHNSIKLMSWLFFSHTCLKLPPHFLGKLYFSIIVRQNLNFMVLHKKTKLQK